MTMTIEVEAPPLTQCKDGSIRVGGTRVLLEIVVNAYKNGDSPEEIAYCYPAISLQDAYSVIAYYLKHTQQVELYLGEVLRRGEANRHEIEKRSVPPAGLKAMLLARRAMAKTGEAEPHAIVGRG